MNKLVKGKRIEPTILSKKEIRHEIWTSLMIK
jgi:hypothetical protein